MSYTNRARLPGERFAPGNAAPAAAAPLTASAGSPDNDSTSDPGWHYVGTFDNDATIGQIRFLARVGTALGEADGAVFRTAMRRGLEYTVAAQFPNGGFPQCFPLEGGYHDSVTFNDNSLINILNLLRDAARGVGDFSTVPADLRGRASRAVDRGIACILASQIVVEGRRTAWCQQHDALTLAPTSARNYEMPSQSSSESDDVMALLMALPDPSPEIVASIHAAAAWFQKTILREVAFRAVAGSGRLLVTQEGAPPLWARFYEIGTDRPIFGDRDKTIHDKVDEISMERRNGYAWFGGGPARILEDYSQWAKAHPAR